MTAKDYNDIRIAEGTAVTIGNFDGVHLGHRFLMENTKRIAAKSGLKTAVLTFAPHPREYFGIDNFFLITTIKEKTLILNKLDIDYNLFVKFDAELSSLSPNDFVNEILLKALCCKHVIVGENFRFGRNKSGGVSDLTELCAASGIQVDYFSPVKRGGIKVSSDRIRGLLSTGDVSGANELLGEPYFVCAEIIRGKSFGRTLGFPTINQAVESNKLLPKYGVFFTQTLLNGNCYNGITNVGVCPTVGGTVKTIETFLFDFEGEAYGQSATVMFLRRQRDEITFDGTDSLRQAIERDKREAMEYFGIKCQ